MSASSSATPAAAPALSPTTDYGAFVLSVLGRMKRESGAIDQAVLQQALGLSSSYLVTDSAMDPDRGAHTWAVGFHRLVDVLVALHARGELELETVDAASKACSECWSVAGNWRGLEECREGVRAVAAKLRTLLDDNGRTYRGGRVYTP